MLSVTPSPRLAVRQRACHIQGMKWIPNALTIARCVFAVLVFIGIWNGEQVNNLLDEAIIPSNDEFEHIAARQQLWYQFGFLAFLAGALTDFLDGWIARKLNAHSRFGIWLDPIADKLLIAAALFGLAVILKSWLIYIPAAIIIARDIFMTWFRTQPVGKSAVSPSGLAKWKTAFEMIAIIGLLLPFALWPKPVESAVTSSSSWPIYIAVALLWVAAVLSAYTGAQYVLSAHRQTET